jgi:acetyl-CoA C-acetyltransferase
VHFAAQAVLSGTQDLVVAGGVQNMSAIPISAAMTAGEQFGFSTPFAQSPGWLARYGDQEVSQFRAAEMIAEKWDISREEMEAFAQRSHERARAATAAGRFVDEIEPVGDVEVDECPRETSLEKMAALAPLVPGGRLTAALASQISDGASAVLVASARAVDEHGLRPRARVHHLSVRGDDPVWMLTGPIEATRHALQRTGLGIDDIDLFEVNEAFASVVLAWARETGADLDRVNVNGGAIALGHPIGATGTRLMTTMLSELERRGGRYALQTMCEGGGQANVTIIERT